MSPRTSCASLYQKDWAGFLLARQILPAVYHSGTYHELPFDYKVLSISYPCATTLNLHVSLSHSKTTLDAILLASLYTLG